MKENLIAGVVSGLVVTAFVVVFRELWNRILVPWFEERVYKDVKIEGSWFSLYPTVKGNRQEAITLNRHGHTVTGTVVCTTGADQAEQYQITGSFRNLILPLIYEISDRTKTDRGTITLRLVHNAERFEGKLAAYNTYRGDIDDLDVIWFRTQAAREEFLTELVKRESVVKEFRKQQLEADRTKKELTKPAKESTSANSEETSTPKNEVKPIEPVPAVPSVEPPEAPTPNDRSA